MPFLIEIGNDKNKEENNFIDKNLNKFKKISFNFEIDSFSISPNLNCLIGFNKKNTNIQIFYNNSL